MQGMRELCYTQETQPGTITTCSNQRRTREVVEEVALLQQDDCPGGSQERRNLARRRLHLCRDRWEREQGERVAQGVSFCRCRLSCASKFEV